MKFVILYLICGFICAVLCWKFEKSGVMGENTKENIVFLNEYPRIKIAVFIVTMLIFPIVVAGDCIIYVYNRINGYN